MENKETNNINIQEVGKQETEKSTEKDTNKSTEKDKKDIEKSTNKSTKKGYGNNGNLIPNAERTPSELREMTKNGGIASGIARRQKRTIKDSLKALLEMKPTTKERELLESQGLAKEGDDLAKGDVIALVLYREAMKGNIRAIDNLLQIQTELIQKEEAKTTDIIGALTNTAKEVWGDSESSDKVESDDTDKIDNENIDKADSESVDKANNDSTEEPKGGE